MIMWLVPLFNICSGGAGVNKSDNFTMAIDLPVDAVVIVKAEAINDIY